MVDIIVADTHRIVCKGLRAIAESDSELRVVGEAYDGSALLTLNKQLEPDLIITEVNLPIINGIAACRQMTRENPNTNILFLSSYLDDRDIVAAIDAGGSGYVSKCISEKALLEAVHAIICGQSVFDSEVIKKMCGHYNKVFNLPRSGSDEQEDLSPREHEVLALICQGLPNEVIAKELFVSKNTVKTHISHVLKKLGAKTRTEAMAFVMNGNIAQ